MTEKNFDTMKPMTRINLPRKAHRLKGGTGI